VCSAALLGARQATIQQRADLLLVSELFFSFRWLGVGELLMVLISYLEKGSWRLEHSPGLTCRELL